MGESQACLSQSECPDPSGLPGSKRAVIALWRNRFWPGFLDEGTQGLESVSVNDLQESYYATPAIADGRIYLRTGKSLYWEVFERGFDNCAAVE